MDTLAIKIENLGKLYKIGETRTRYRTVREVMINAAKAPMKKTISLVKGEAYGAAGLKEELWALKNVSLGIEQGDVLGIIGRNGAGKTTLLRILSRITEPTTGRAEIRGKVGSLLEVGTGMHPELTGRENVYLNGATLGMKKSEIENKFDEIVEFSGMGKFIDTPLKHYSTGMQVRLAFSVAAHLEPEILLVDEVLAVGDISFQKKCLGKMSEVAEGGRTVLFVSHQMNAIRRLCSKCIWLENGQIKMLGPASEVVSAYEAAFTSRISIQEEDRMIDDQSPANFIKWEMTNQEPEKPYIIDTFNEISFRFILRVNRPFLYGTHGIGLYDQNGQLLWGTAAYGLELDKGLYEFKYDLPSLMLRPGLYYFRVSIYNEQGLADVWESIPDLVIATPPVTHPHDEWSGVLNIPYSFQERKIDE